MDNRSDQIEQLAEALAQAQGMMRNAGYNRKNPHFGNRYADMAAVIDAIREPLAKAGLGWSQLITPGINELWLETFLFHKASGQWLKSAYPLPTGTKPQEFGSALTYARRYSLTSLVGIAGDEDDDAEVAQSAKRTELIKPPSEPTISADEADYIETLLAKVKAKDAQLFIQKAGVDIPDLPAAKYKAMVQWLEARVPKDRE
jgi:hypothetical protein